MLLEVSKMVVFWVTLLIQGVTLFSIIYIHYNDSENEQVKTKCLIFLIVFLLILFMVLFEFEPFGIKEYLSRLSGGHGGDWLQFWGTYLGIIFSVILTLYATNKQGQIDRKNARNIHAIEIYIDNLMSALDILIKLQPLVHRCKNYLKMVESKQLSTSELDKERELLIEEADKEKNRGNELKNIIKKMPLESKEKLQEPIERLCLTALLFGHTGDNIPEHTKYEESVGVFIEDYKFINKFITNEIDEYNKVK